MHFPCKYIFVSLCKVFLAPHSPSIWDRCYARCHFLLGVCMYKVELLPQAVIWPSLLPKVQIQVEDYKVWY